MFWGYFGWSVGFLLVKIGQIDFCWLSVGRSFGFRWSVNWILLVGRLDFCWLVCWIFVG